MKKLVVLLALATMLFSTGCATSEAPIPTPPSTPTPTPTPSPIPSPSPEPTPPPVGIFRELKVHFIDVGEGDAILIDQQEIEVLIDGGDRSPGIVSYLKTCVDGPVELMVATNPHSDHIGGLIDVLAAFQVKEIWHNGETVPSKTCREFMSAVEAENALVVQVARGHSMELDGLILKVLHPANLNDTIDNNSIVLHLAHGQIDFLFTGDVEREAEGAMLKKSDMPVPDVEVLKVGHHGSRTASSFTFLAVTTPEVAIYMAGGGNSDGYPHGDTISALCNAGAEVYGTDVHGSIIITSDGKKYEIQLGKEAPAILPLIPP